jgi:hypothetical protein
MVQSRDTRFQVVNNPSLIVMHLFFSHASRTD